MRGAVLGVLVLAAPAWAAHPEYSFEVQARTNLVGNASGAFNLEPGNLLPEENFSIPITDERKVGFVLSTTPEGRHALWYGGDGVGRRIYQLPSLGDDAVIGELSINSHGQAAFTVTGAANETDNGIYVLDVATPEQVRVIREPQGATSWDSLSLNEAGQIVARVTLGIGRAYALYTPRNDGFDTDILVSENTVDGNSPYATLHSPSLNDNGQVAGVADRLVVVDSDTSYRLQYLYVWSAIAPPQLIVDTETSSVASILPVAPAINNRGHVAFLGTYRTGPNTTPTALFVADSPQARLMVAEDGIGDIKALESFSPDINDNEHVVFRATRASDGLSAVWVFAGDSIKPVVVEHDILSSDLGDARVGWNTLSDSVFAGAPSINAHGDIAFAAGLVSPDEDEEEWGTAIYVARASSSGVGGADGGVGADGGTGEPNPGANPSSNTDSGCGCASTSLAGLWPWAVAGLMGLSRRLSSCRRERSARD